MSATARGTDFEKEVFSYLQEELKAGRLHFVPERSAIYHQKGYHSRDRNSNIVFDIAIEVTFPGMPTPSAYCLVECKDHTRKIQVDDVEAFFGKIQQVASAAAKGIIVSRSSFQPAALEYARSKGIGILRFPQRKWELARSMTARYAVSFARKDDEIRKVLTEENYQITGPDCVCNYGNTFTYSLYDFIGAMTADVLGNLSYILVAERPTPAVVPFMSPAAIDVRCSSIHTAIQYRYGPVSMEAICEWQNNSCGLTVLRNARADDEAVSKGILGRISFTPPSIVIFSDPTGPSRERFTLAHELGHLLLGHGEYLQAENFDVRDIESCETDDLESDMIRRLEWQANRFASSLLLPAQQFIQIAKTKAASMGLKDKGFGLIYRDYQPENERNYMAITSALMSEFDVSRRAVELRLKGLGLSRV
jgi:Zn-dependent peptidase ImmA (M78 family)